MENKTNIKSLIETTVAGKLDHVYKTIKTLPKQLEENTAIKFIIACCNACNNNLSTPDKLNEDDLVKLLKHLLSRIRTPLKDHCDSYLQSVFFIVKLLIEKKSLECIIKLEELLMPEFLPLIFTEKQTTIHHNICKLLYNIIVRVSNAQEKQHRQSVLKLSFFLTQLYKKTRNLNKLLDSVHNCIISLAALNVDPQSLLDYYSNSLNLLDDVRDPSIYHSLIDNFSCLYAHLLKTTRFELAHSCYKHTILKLKLHNNKEQRHLSEILEIVNWINPSSENKDNDTPTKAHNTLKNYYKQSKTTNNLQSICDLVSSVAFVMLQHYKTNDSQKWVELSPDVQSELFKFLHDVSHIMSETRHQCHCKQCSTKTNLNEALRTLESVAGLGRLFISKKSDVSRGYKMDVFRYLEKYTDYVTLLKQNGCPKWSSYWYNAGVHLYTIGLHLQEQKDFDTCAIYMKKFVKTFIELEEDGSKIIDRIYLTSALNVISDTYLEVKDYEKCLLMIAFAMTLNPANNRDLMNRWIKTKVACRENTILENNEIQELTVVSVCTKHSHELGEYFPDKTFRLDERKKTVMLTQELANYKAKWKSKVPMMAAYRDLSRITESVRCAQVFIEVWGECDLRVHDSLPELLEHTVRKLEVDTRNRRNVQIKFYLAHLYFLQHKYRVKDTIIKHCDEMEKTMSLTRTDNVPPDDPQDECEIVSSYNCLKLSIYLKMLKQLTKSSDMVVELFKDEVINLSDKEKLYRLLIKMGHEYTLHCFVAKSLETLHYALAIARLEGNKAHILQTIGFIIEQTDVTRPQIRKLIEEAEGFLPSLLESHLEDSILYYLCKSEAFFYSDFDTAYEAYNLATKYSNKLKPSDILKARLYFLHHKFITLPCEFGVEGHKEYSLVRIHNAHDHAIRHYSENSNDSSYDMKIFFDICQHLLKMYHELRFPREVRCYGKEMVVIAQKMVLPFRTVSLLSYLSEADSLSCRFDDFRVKLTGISDILCLSKSVSKQLPLPERKMDDRAVDNLANEFGEMILDVPMKSTHSTLTGSPIFREETFDFPAFLLHELACECFYCVSIEYQQMVLTEVRLRAVFSERTNDQTQAQEFFRGGVRIFECLKKKKDVCLTKIARRIPSELVPTWWKKFEMEYCEILREYGDFFLRRERVKDAESVNRKARELLEPYRLEAIHLYNEILVQRLNILSAKTSRDKVKKEREAVEELNTAMAVVKTPENKQSTVVISPRASPEHVEVVKIVPKSLKFDLEDEDEPSATKKKDNKNLPPFLNMAANAKTPLPSSGKIKIYTEEKSTRKKKVLTDIPLPSKSVRSLDFVVPMSPEAYTPQTARKKADSSLLSNRTKVLTEKLRSSSRKKTPSIVVSDENHSEGGKERVRQNLLGQLEEGDEEEKKKGAVRRSARNRR